MCVRASACVCVCLARVCKMPELALGSFGVLGAASCARETLWNSFQPLQVFPTVSASHLARLASNWNTKRTWFVSYAFIPLASFCGSNKQNENNNNSNNNPSIHLLKNLESCRVSFLAWLSFLWLSSVVVFNTHAHTHTCTHAYLCVLFLCLCALTPPFAFFSLTNCSSSFDTWPLSACPPLSLLLSFACASSFPFVIKLNFSHISSETS